MIEEDNLIDAALKQAIKALGSTPVSKIRQLTLSECALALSALPNIASLTQVRERLAERLQTQLTSTWIKKGDLYEVFSALRALWQYNSKSITGEYLAYAIERLIESETATGGPYYSSNNVVDIAANAQIAMLIRLVAKSLPGVDGFIGDTITARRFENSALTVPGVLYLLGQAQSGSQLTRLMTHYQQQSHWQTPLHKAIALSILDDTLSSHEIQQKLVAICGEQRPSGFWTGESILLGVTGHHFTTTAIIVESLGTYYDHVKASSSDLQQWHQNVLQAVRQDFNRYNEPLRSSASTALDRICGGENNMEITLLPYFFARALKVPAPLTDQHCITLGSANACSWIAYTIYDDFLDDEGVPALLSVANSAMRDALNYFRTALPGHSDFHQYVADVFTAMDETNSWEITHCRFAMQHKTVVISRLPEYGERALLAARSFAHALGPMAIVAQLPPRTQTTARHIETAFRQYLIARQLSDDMHDWLEDMQAGHVSYVVTAILRDMQIPSGTHTMSTLLPAMQRCFRQTTMPQICRDILLHIHAAKQEFESSQLLKPMNDIYVLLDNLELSVRQALDEHSKSRTFEKVRINKASII